LHDNGKTLGEEMGKYITAGIGVLTVGAMLVAIPLTIAGFGVNADTYVYEENPDKNFGLAEQLRVISGTTSDANTLLDFNIRFEENITLNKAELKLYADNINIGFGSRICASQITSSWGYNLVTWRTQPSYESPSMENCISNPTNRITFNVTNIVQDWLDGESNYGIAIVGQGQVHATFHSMDSTLITTFPPTLTIDYTIFEEGKEEDKTVIVDPSDEDDPIDTTDSKGEETEDDVTTFPEIPWWAIVIMVAGVILIIIGLIKRR
jgi:hypothetical protein